MVLALTAGAKTREQFSNLPAVYIDLADPYAVIDKETYLDCSVEFTGAGSDTIFADGRIRGRGNSTWVRGPKLPYRLKFRSKHRLLGPDRANAKNWVLLANNFDKTLIRNAVASFIATECGQAFAPGAQFVDLVLNGRFIGNYQITDHLDIRKRRINIFEQETVAASDDNITGGYFLEFCNDETGSDVMQTLMGSIVRIKSPDEDVINKEQKKYIRGHLNDFESRLFGRNFLDPVKGYRPLTDSLSLASWYLANEFSANPDMYWSTNVYKERDDDRLFFGPVWDFDIAFNNSSRQGDISDRRMLDVGFHCTTNVGGWVSRMMQDPWFTSLLEREWRRIADSGIEERVIAYIDSLAGELDASQRLNYELYNIREPYWDEYMLFSTYLENVEYLKDAVHKRMQFMNKTYLGMESEEPEQPVESSKYVVPSVAGVYEIYNLGVMMPLRPGNGEVVIGIPTGEDDTRFRWRIRPDGDGFRILSLDGTLAVTDADAHGSTLKLQPVNPADSKQLWHIIPLGNKENSCVVASVASNRAWNNNGGHADEGNALISWTNDEDNSWKTTRQWRFSLLEEEQQDGIVAPEAPDYAVTYSPSAQKLRFIAYGEALMQGRFELFTTSGMQALAGSIAPEIDLSQLARGVYILRWSTPDGKTRVLKFQK